MQDALEAVSSAGCCLFSAQTFVPGIFFDLGPNSPITRLVGKIMPWMGPMVALLLNMTPLVAFNSLFILAARGGAAPGDGAAHVHGPVPRFGRALV